MQRWCLLLFTAAIACADATSDLRATAADAGASPPGERERRLVPYGYDLGDGATVELGIEDTALGVACAPQRDVEGTWRCLPNAWNTTSEVEALFADPSCTVPAIHAYYERRYAQSMPRFITASAPYCDADRLVEVFEVRGAQQREVYQQTESGCRPRNDGFGRTWPDYVPVAPISADTFVRLERELQTLDGDLARVTFSTEAGARFDWAVVDRRENAACAPSVVDGQPACGPEQVGVVRFEDDTCSGAPTAAQLPFGAACVSGDLMWAHRVDGCGGPRLMRLDRPLGSVESTFTPWPGGECSPRSPWPEDWEVLRARPVDPSTTLPRLSRARAGRGRIEARYFAGADGSVLHRRAATLFDTELGVDCEVRDVDGTSRCVPSPAATLAGGFEDPECTRPIETGVARYVGSGEPEIALEVDIYDPPPTATVLRLWAIGEELSPARIFVETFDDEAPCQPLTDTGFFLPCSRYFRLGALQDPARYAPATEGPLGGGPD